MIDRGFWQGRRVLLTGHTGFKGAWLALWLADLGAEVTGFGGPPPSDPSLFARARVDELVHDVRGDVRDAAAIGAAMGGCAPEVVFHLAAQPLVLEALRHPAETYDVNVTGTARILDAVREHAPGAAVVVVTSDKCYANDDAGRPFTEADPLGGRDPYSSSKAAQEHVAAAYRASYGLRIATARAGNVIGGGDWGRDRLVPDLVRAVDAGAPLRVRNPDAVRPWQHVLNPLSGYLLLAQRLAGSDGEAVARAWNFGPEEDAQRSVRELIGLLAERWPGPLEVQASPAATASAEAQVLRLDSSASRRRLGWRPPISLTAALDEVVAGYRAADARATALRAIAISSDQHHGARPS